MRLFDFIQSSPYKYDGSRTDRLTLLSREENILTVVYSSTAVYTVYSSKYTYSIVPTITL